MNSLSLPIFINDIPSTYESKDCLLWLNKHASAFTYGGERIAFVFSWKELDKFEHGKRRPSFEAKELLNENQNETKKREIFAS